MSHVLLDGALVPSESIDPKLHTFIGVFRPTFRPPSGGYVLCPCGTILQTYQTLFEHYNRGCHDINQYVSIERLHPAARSTQ